MKELIKETYKQMHILNKIFLVFQLGLIGYFIWVAITNIHNLKLALWCLACVIVNAICLVNEINTWVKRAKDYMNFTERLREERRQEILKTLPNGETYKG